MDVIAIVTDYLEKNGFDGLYHDGDCACENKDLAPCGEIEGSCEAGYKTDAPKHCPADWHIGSRNSDNTCNECCD
jgi:hypothetical protein|tara:strand:+ start:3606 stop:3830 length:225 start_codon:yes stop_codon:yes gene_type:complete